MAAGSRKWSRNEARKCPALYKAIQGICILFIIAVELKSALDLYTMSEGKEKVARAPVSNITAAQQDLHSCNSSESQSLAEATNQLQVFRPSYCAENAADAIDCLLKTEVVAVQAMDNPVAGGDKLVMAKHTGNPNLHHARNLPLSMEVDQHECSFIFVGVGQQNK